MGELLQDLGGNRTQLLTSCCARLLWPDDRLRPQDVRRQPLAPNSQSGTACTDARMLKGAQRSIEGFVLRACETNLFARSKLFPRAPRDVYIHGYRWRNVAVSATGGLETLELV